MEYGMDGMRMDRESLKQFGRTKRKLDYGQNGIRMDRSIKKRLTRMEN